MAKIILDATNIKTGKGGWVVSQYNRRSDGKAMVEVDVGMGRRHWLASSAVIKEIYL
jgi:hypothetical protein